MIGLGICVWFVDLRGVKKASMPFVVLGANSIFIYLMSGFFMHYFSMIPGGTFNGEKIGLFRAIYFHVYEPALGGISPQFAALALSLTYVAMWMAIGWIFYKKRIFIKL
jgi:predicted acyltransferase